MAAFGNYIKWSQQPFWNEWSKWNEKYLYEKRNKIDSRFMGGALLT